MSEDWGDGPEFAAGSLVAGYRLEEQIGRGGMAMVYRAHDSRLDRDVALKILAPGLSQDEGFRQRVIRESQAAASVDEPHIIPVYETGEDRGVLFIAMHLVRGGDARSLLDRDGPLSPGRVTEIISQVASALDAAHARGLAHRNVKPANMLLEENPDSDRPYPHLPDRLRAGSGLAGPGGHRADRHRPDPRHPRLRGARAGRGPSRRRAGRPVRAGLRGLRAADRSTAVPQQ